MTRFAELSKQEAREFALSARSKIIRELLLEQGLGAARFTAPFGACPPQPWVATVENWIIQPEVPVL